MIGEPANSEYNQNDNEHLGNFPHLLLCSSVIVSVAGEGRLPLEFPQDSAEVGVGDGETEEGQDVGHQEEDDLVHVVHERGGLGSIRPHNDAGCGRVVPVTVVGLDGGEQDGRAGQQRADRPDGEHQEGQTSWTHLSSGAGDCQVS